MLTPELDARKREILRAIVEDYISKGEPVGSSHLARRTELDVSTATIRAAMADLEDLGFLEKPHTSAGRVPTDRGYRFFVDALLHVRPSADPEARHGSLGAVRLPPQRDREAIDRAVPEASTVDETLGQVSRTLHDLSRHASLVLTPKPDEGTFRRVELVRLREDRVLAILVSQAGAVQNKLLRLDAPMSQDELTRASNYLNALLAQLPLEAARERIARELADQALLYDQLTRRALTLAQGLMFSDPTSDDGRVRIEGQGSLLEDFSRDVARARAALRLLEEKKRILLVLDQARTARELQIFIGAESGFSLEGMALVACPFEGEGILGTLGVIGPSRMNYSKVISLVDYTARAVTRALSM